MNSFTENVRKIIKSIPFGKVTSYGRIAAMAGNNRSARQVSWILNNSAKEQLPWHRVVNSKGGISLPDHNGGLIQKGLLENEGVVFNKNGTVEKKFFWDGSINCD